MDMISSIIICGTLLVYIWLGIIGAVGVRFRLIHPRFLMFSVVGTCISLIGVYQYFQYYDSPNIKNIDMVFSIIDIALCGFSVYAIIIVVDTIRKGISKLRNTCMLESTNRKMVINGFRSLLTEIGTDTYQFSSDNSLITVTKKGMDSIEIRKEKKK